MSDRARRERVQLRIARLRDVLKHDGLDALLLSDPASVSWITEEPALIEVGPMPWTAGSFVVLTATDVVVVCDSADVTALSGSGFRMECYNSEPIGGWLHPHQAANHSVGKLLGTGTDTADVRLGIEQGTAPWIRTAFARVHDVTDAVLLARSIKDSYELHKIKEAVELVNVGQRVVREVAAPGRREIDVWGDVHAAMCATAGERVPVVVDLMAGERCMTIGTPPSAHRIEPDSLVLCDLAPRRGVYWADSCVTFCVGTPTADMRRAHDASRRCLDVAIAGCRAGRLASEVDTETRQLMDSLGYSYPHHTGHGVGLSFHEAPRIVARSNVMLEQGMVIAVEPGAYANGIGVRLEHLVYIGLHGPEILTDFPMDLEQNPQ